MVCACIAYASAASDIRLAVDFTSRASAERRRDYQTGLEARTIPPHHVRFWLVLDQGTDRRPVWLDSITFDRGVELSRDTGQVTHHIAPDIDAERDLLMYDLRDAGMV